ncbi:MAG: phosphate regulon transcriptional regulator PhoB [Gammaproteobacteria bacterium]|nr:phosphate regulon transcriptional regulator PhoB [Gammaproteobacteria bacterium]
MSNKILIVDDEQAIREMVSFALTRAGFEVLEAADAQQAQTVVADELPDLLLLDWMMPGVSGLDLARRLKREELTRDLPIIMLTARGEEEEKIRGLEVGADDYVTKPFSPRELVARIKAVMRRANPQSGEEIIEFDGLKIDPAGHRVTAMGRALEMGPTEFRLLHFFVTHPDRVYSRSQLLDRVWGGNVYIEERTIDVHIRRLRKALSPEGHDRFVQTVRGAGYRFSKQV